VVVIFKKKDSLLRRQHEGETCEWVVKDRGRRLGTEPRGLPDARGPLKALPGNTCTVRLMGTRCSQDGLWANVLEPSTPTLGICIQTGITPSD